jgi:hypothetical protein
MFGPCQYGKVVMALIKANIYRRGGAEMRTNVLIGKVIANLLTHKPNNGKRKRRREKAKRKEQMVNMFGKVRYYLALLFGEWALWTCNPAIYEKKAVCKQPSNIIYLADYKVAR